MLTLWRPLVLAAFFLPVLAASAAAQTVIVTHAPRQGKIEVVLGGKAAGAATADVSGVATIPINLKTATGAQQIDVRVYVDVCAQLHRILIVERNQLPAAREESCDRREIPGIFWLRPINTMVVNVGGAIPTLLLARGRYDVNNPTPVKRSPRGLVVFGGGGLIGFDELAAAACGTVVDCRQDGSGGVFSAGAGFWIRPWLAAEGSYLRPSRLTTAGGVLDAFDFTSEFDVHIFTALANAGVAAGPVRVYGKAGFNFHRATTTIRQVAGAESQTIEFGTQGWGPVYGAGFEGWFKPRIGIYAEGVFGRLKGEPRIQDVEGEMDEGFQYFVVGARVKIF